MISVINTNPLIVRITENEAVSLDGIDAGVAYTKFLHSRIGRFEEEPLGTFVDIVSSGVNPRSVKHADVMFEYVDLREVDDLTGQVMMFRKQPGRRIGSNKHRFQKWDFLFAKIQPSRVLKNPM